MQTFLCWAALAAALLVGAGGCASTCREVEASRNAFLRAARPSAAWHGAIVLPHAVVTPLINQHLAKVPPLELGVPGPFGAMLPPLVLTTKHVALRPARAGEVAFRVDLEAALGGQSAFFVEAHISVAPRVNAQHELEVALRPEDVETLEPRIAPGAIDRLTELCWKPVPALSRLPRQVANQLASGAVSMLGRELHALMRKTVLPKLGALSHLKVALPPYLPVQQIGFETTGGKDPALVVLVRSRLAASPGLTLPEAAVPRGTPGHLHVVLPGATVAALTNWGMAEKLLPSRFDSSAHPQADGPNEVALDWEPGPRPLKVIAWHIHGKPCGTVHLGGEPELKVPKRGSIELGVREAQVERVTGSFWLQAAVWLRLRISDSFDITRKLAADTKISVGGRPLQLTVTEGDYAQGVFWVGLEVAPPAR